VITKLILDVFLGVVTQFFQVLPTYTLPTIFGDASTPGSLGDFMDGMSNALGDLRGWLPIEHAVIAIGMVGAAMVVAVVIRGARIVASFLTFGGGAGA